MNIKCLSSIPVLFFLTCLCCCGQIEGLRLFKEWRDSTSDERTSSPAVATVAAASAAGESMSGLAAFGSSQVKSGARSAYQLAPFGEGFGFADLLGLFSQRDTKQPPNAIDGLSPIQLDDNLISMYDDQTPIIVNNKHRDKTKTGFVPGHLKSGSKSGDARTLNLGAWNHFMLAHDRGVSSDIKPALVNQTVGGVGSSNLTLVSPIILVPGYGGSRLEAKLDKSNSVHYFCDTKTADWMDLWINVKQLLPYMIDCLIDNMRLEFDPRTNRTRNPVGVDIRVKNGSQVASVEYLNSLQISGFAYFAPIIEQLTESHQLMGSYERELNIRAAPYDFRKAPNELGEYFDNLRGSSEQLVRETGGRPISFICHSMGCNNMLYFLHQQTDEWKSKHVKRLISIAAPWAGSVSAMRAAAVGDDLGMPYLFSESKLLLVQRSLPSTIFLFPHKQAFSGVPLVKSNVDIPMLAPELKQQASDKHPGNGDDETTQIITRTSPGGSTNQQQQQQVYMADDFRKFFEDINHPDGYKMWLNTKDLLGSLEAPGVEVWCLVGGSKQTIARIEYSGEFPTSTSQEIYDDGDGTVTTQSADYCKRWSSGQQQPVYYRQFATDHLNILKDSQVLQYIERILANDLAANNM